MIYEVFVDQMLVMDQSNSRVNPRGVSATNTLIVTQLAKNYRQYASASNFLNIGHVASARKSITHVTVEQTLEVFGGGFRYAASEHVTQYLVLGSLARTVEYERVGQTLLVTQGAEGALVRAGRTTLSMTQAATCSVVRSRSVTQTIVIYSGGTVAIEDEERYGIALPTLSGPNAPECH